MTQPNDVYAELELLGSILRAPEESMIRIAGDGLVRATDIYAPEHRLIADAIFDLDRQSQGITPTSIASWLDRKNSLEQAGGLTYIESLISHAGNLESAASRIVHSSILRQLMAFGAYTSMQAANGNDPLALLDELENDLYDIRRRQSTQVTSLGAMLTALEARIDRRRTGDLSDTLRLNFAPIDSLLGDIEKNDYVLVGGRPGDGKSSWIKWLTYQVAVAAENRRGVYIGNFEEGESTFAMKMVSIHTNISTKLLRHPELLSQAQLDQVKQAIRDISQAPIYVDCKSGMTPSQYKARVMDAARKCEREHGVPLAFHSPDYIQLMRGEGDSGNEKHTSVSQAMRGMCQPDQLNIPCIGTAQLSRASANGATGRLRPYQLSDLRESGSYEQDATIVMFINRPWIFNAPADHEVRRFQENVDGSTGQLHQEWMAEPVFLNVAKARNGGVGNTRKVLWRRYSGRFEEDVRVETL